MESTLALTLNDLKAEAGYEFGFGRGALYGEEAWTTRKEAEITRAVQAALRMVHQATLTGDGGTPKIHSWSWLRPYAEIAVALGGREVNLPDDYGGLDGMLTISRAGESGFCPIKVDNAEAVRNRYAAMSNATGRPQMAAIEPVRGTSAHRGTRFKLLVYPQADQAYTVGMHYTYLPDFLTGANPYPLGGAGMAEVYRAAVRAVVEAQHNGQPEGPMSRHFQAVLVAAVAADRRNKPQSLGYNSDHSDGRHWPWRRRPDYVTRTITIAGQDPG